jgi:26-hydroxylase
MAIAMRLLERLCEEAACPSFLLLASFLLPLLLICLLRRLRHLSRLPPGPSGYPLFGILPLITKQFHLQLFDYAQKFGKILSLKMGSQMVVVLNDPNVIKKAFARPEFSGRPKSALSSILNGYGKKSNFLIYLLLYKFIQLKNYAALYFLQKVHIFLASILTSRLFLFQGIISSEGSLWSAQRRFLHKQKFGLKHWGNMGERMESVVMHEVQAFLSTLAAESSCSPLNPAPILNCFISNVICTITMSTRFLPNDAKFRRFMHLFDEGFRLFTQTGALLFLPVLRHLPGMRAVCEQLKRNRDEMLRFVQEIVADHEDSLDPKAPRDLVDSYLLEIQSADAANMEQLFPDGKEPRTQLYQIMLDLFSAGVETLKTTLQWSMLHMVHNPEVKGRVQAELERVVGPNRLPSMADMAELPYTRATIYEVVRRSNVVPMGTTHATDR